MKRFSYAERDYDFGQAMLTLRTTIGLTQAGLADLLGVSRRAVGEWEAGISYPKAEHLKALLTLAVQQGPFQPVAKPRRSVPSGNLRPGFEAYGHLLRQVAQTGHQSYLLLTSREKPAALRSLEGSRTPVRSLPLSGLEAAACAQLLAEHEVSGSPDERARLGAVYAGNPLALNIVAETIADLFGGQIDPFLAGGTPIFGSISELLDEQWARLSPLDLIQTPLAGRLGSWFSTRQ